MKVLGVAAAYLALAAVATWPLVLRAHDSVFGLGTPPLNVWAMGWVLHQLPRDPVHLFDGNAFFPYARSLAFSEHLLVPSLLGAPFVFASGNLVLAHNAVALLTLALAGLGMYLLCHELVGDSLAAFGGGLFYAFHTWNINELIRLQILSNAWFPFLLLALLRFFRAPSGRNAVAAGTAYAAQSLSCMYWALYLPWVTGPALLFLARRHRVSVKRVLPLAGSLGAAVALTAAMAIPYIQNGREFGLHRAEPAPVAVDRYLDVLPGNLLYAHTLGTARVNENAAHFLGFGSLLLALAAFASSRGAKTEIGHWRGLLALFVFGGFLLSLGTRIVVAGHDLMPGPYSAFYHFIPGFGHVRYPERFSLVLVLGLAPLVAGGLLWLRGRAGTLAAAAACALLFVEHLSAPLALEPLPPPAKAPTVYRWLAEQPEVRVVVEVPSSRNWMERSDALPMYFSTMHWKKTPQGFTGYFPPASPFVRWRLFHFPDGESVDFLRKLGVDTVVVRSSGGRPPEWVRPTPAWSVTGPFPEGDVVLRLPGVDRLAYAPPPSSDVSGLEELDRANWRVFASHPDPGRARDRNEKTSWTTGDETRVGDHFAVRFVEPTRVARISIAVLDPFEFPTRLELLGRTREGTSLTIPYDRTSAYDALFALLLYRPREARLDLDVVTPLLRELRLNVTGNDHFLLPWTMAELRLYRLREEPPGPGAGAEPE